MAKAAVNSTYTTVEIPLVSDLDTRVGQNPTTEDAYFENFLPEIIENPSNKEKIVALTKREGTTTFTVGAGTDQPRGLFYWKDVGFIYSVVNANCYVYNTSGVLITTLFGIVGAGIGSVGFCTYLYNTNITVLMITDGTTLSQISTTNIVTPCVDPDLPTPHLPTPVYYDGYLLLVKSNTGDCYNSDLNNPLSWTPGNFITAEISPDVILGITTVNNFFVLFGSDSIEYFYDAGNPTGTPFARNDTFVKLNGFIGGLTKYGNKIYFIGTNQNSVPDVFVLENFTIKPLATPAVRKWLTTYIINNLTLGTIISLQGADMYVVASNEGTYFLNLTNNIWGKFSYKNTSSFKLGRCTLIRDVSGQSFNIFSFSAEVGTGSPTLYKFSNSLYTDSGTDYTSTVLTDKFYFNTLNNKFQGNISIMADRNITDPSPLMISWTDDDYQTYSIPRTVDLNGERPQIQQCGRFRSRAYKLTHTAPVYAKLYKAQADMNMGVT